jgi:hypothetical protein
MVSIRLVLLGAAALGIVGPLSAQDTLRSPTGRTGFWMGGGFGAGAGRIGCDICREDRDIGPAAQLRLGGRLNEHLLFGVEGNGWMSNDPEQGVRDLMLAVGGVLYWYPNPRGARYYLKAGLGPVFYRAEDSDVAVDETAEEAVTARGFGAHLGVGYELQVGRVAIVPFFNFTDTVFSTDLVQGDTRLAPVNINLMQIGVGINWR